MLIAFGFAFATIYSKTNISKKFGDFPAAIFEAYHRGEKLLFYADYAAKNSIYQSAYELGQKGGFYSTDCGDYLGYAVWENECHLNMGSLKSNFSLYLQDNINYYLLDYPEEDIFIPQDNYDFLIKDDKVIGIAGENVEIDVRGIKEKRYGAVYTVPKGAEEILRETKSRYGSYIESASETFSVQDSLITAVIAQESGGNQNTISYTGCAGLMQFCYSTALLFRDIFVRLTPCECTGETCRINHKCSLNNDDRFNSEKSIQAGARYLSQLLDQFKDYTHKEEFAIASYNGGSEVIQKAIRKTGKDDPSWKEVSQQLTPDLITYFADYNEKRNKVVEIKDYVRKVEGYKTKYEEIVWGATAESVEENQVTGAAVEDASDDEKTLGKYSIKPSFNQKPDFDIFEDYIAIAEKAERLKNICKESENAELCINNNKHIFNSNSLILLDSCEIEPKKSFTDFAEMVYLCSRSEGNCICMLNAPDLDYNSIYLEQNKIKMIKNDKILFELDFDVDYEGAGNFEKNSKIILLNRNHKLERHDLEDMSSCAIQKTTFRFCVENNNKQVYAYSEEDKQTKLRNMQYKFAVNFD